MGRIELICTGVRQDHPLTRLGHIGIDIGTRVGSGPGDEVTVGPGWEADRYSTEVRIAEERIGIRCVRCSHHIIWRLDGLADKLDRLKREGVLVSCRLKRRAYGANRKYAATPLGTYELDIARIPPDLSDLDVS